MAIQKAVCLPITAPTAMPHKMITFHSEPGDVFFGISSAKPGWLRFTRLAGRAQLSGDYGFEV
jgi:hypothetical protein